MAAPSARRARSSFFSEAVAAPRVSDRRSRRNESTGSAAGAIAAAPLRVFFAVWPDAPAAAALGVLAGELARRMSGRAPPAANLHLTIAFVGAIPAERVPALQEIGRDAAARAGRFALALDRVGTFRDGGIVWAGATSVPPEITRLAQALSEGLAAAGFAVDPRPFHPHVTLARRCRRAAELAISPPIAWTVTRLVLNVSSLSSSAPRYEDRDGWRLGG
jgi:RNA 2',3'-cyclic 3'-phosphodiesterase